MRSLLVDVLPVFSISLVASTIVSALWNLLAWLAGFDRSQSRRVVLAPWRRGAPLLPAKDARREDQADRDRQRQRPQVRQ